ncbi:Synaptotagmin-12 [Trichinella britovi]|uniref:Synaptotagmin-12 n=2 Tax=Trichinella TaxID=6333 RepID=A0A0V1D9L7_TRIBR|nr:Synaptotagmin-12 [Trichinella murrelli]KRY58224.1 Synaptotagmin-12 [Trichinella britovi]KRZ89710.1 Synaptotagmin-12 [Trichinella sp. T8]
MDHCLLNKMILGNVNFSGHKRGSGGHRKAKHNNTFQVDGRRAFSMQPIVHRNLETPTGNRLKKQALHVRWSHYDTMQVGGGDPVSQVISSLKQVGLHSGSETNSAKEAKMKASRSLSCLSFMLIFFITRCSGKLLVALLYQPEQCRLMVYVLQAKELSPPDSPIDSFAIIWLVQENGECEKRTTAVKYGRCSPIYNEIVSFYIEPRAACEASLVIALSSASSTVMQDEIGHVILGNLSNESGKMQWRQMIAYPNHRIAKWHSLTLKW